MALEALFAVPVTKIINGYLDAREKGPHDRWVGRLNRNYATPGEILAKFYSRSLMAPIVTLNHKAPVRNFGRVRFQSGDVPKFKHGVRFNEEHLDLFARLRQAAIPSDVRQLTNLRDSSIKALVEGIIMGENYAAVGMMTDSISWDMYGIKASAAFAMPSVLKSNFAVAVTDTANSLPIDYIRAYLLSARVGYGMQFDRIEMSTAAFRAIIATTNFGDNVKGYIRPDLTVQRINTSDIQLMQGIMASMLNVTRIDLCDEVYSKENADGTQTMARYLGLSKLLFTRIQDDNADDAWDFAYTTTVESIVADLSGQTTSVLGGLPPVNTQGPVGYVTVPSELDAPEVVFWAVDRGFPRKNQEFRSGVMDVGSLTDPLTYTNYAP